MAKNCPNCGAEVPDALSIARVQACDYCGTTLVQADDVLKQAGSAGEVFDAPLMFTLGQTAQIGEQSFTPFGYIQYDYGRGVWDEFWGEDGKGKPVWVSVDEGDVIWQVQVDVSDKAMGAFKLGARFNLHGVVYTASEVANATCRAFRGQLPEDPAVGEVHMFANFASLDGKLLSGERWEGGHAWYSGKWIDPWEVRRP